MASRNIIKIKKNKKAYKNHVELTSVISYDDTLKVPCTKSNYLSKFEKLCTRTTGNIIAY